MKFYVFTTPEDQLQAMNCDNYALAVLNHKLRADAGDHEAKEWVEALIQAYPVEALDAFHAKELFQARQAA